MTMTREGMGTSWRTGRRAGRPGATFARESRAAVPPSSMRRVVGRVRRLCSAHIVDEITERQIDVVDVQAPIRTEGRRDHGTGVAGTCIDLEPGGTARTLPLDRVQT